MKFKTLVEQASKNIISEDFTDIIGRNVVSDLDDSSHGKTIGRHVNTDELLKIAEAASHPNAEKWHLDKALNHGGMDQIVAAHPKSPLLLLKKILNHSEDSFARMAASHNHNMTPSVLAKSYETEKDPAVKAEMLRSRHMPKDVIASELASELQKSHPSQYKLESISHNINSPHEAVNTAYQRMKDERQPTEGAYKPKTTSVYSKLTKLANEYRLNADTSLGDIKISHTNEPDIHTVTIHAGHVFTDTPDTTSVSVYNANRKLWDRIGSRMDDLSDDDHIKKYFDVSKTSMSLGRANSASKNKSGDLIHHSANIKFTLKPEFQ